MNHRDMLAEIELTMVPSPPVCPESNLYVPASEPADGSRGGSCRRRFWCALRKQHVEVEFATKAVLGFRRIVAVKRCSVFEEPDKVACGRHCLESRFRTQWPYALPLAGYRSSPTR
ncbi:MAG TPA: hypothetical protein VI653_30525 [Steroidobacteraceae bacterium]